MVAAEAIKENPCWVSRTNTALWNDISLFKLLCPWISGTPCRHKGVYWSLPSSGACAAPRLLPPSALWASLCFLPSCSLFVEPGNTHCKEGTSVLLEKEAGYHCQIWLELISVQLARAIVWNSTLFSDFSAMACNTPLTPLPDVLSGSLKIPVLLWACQENWTQTTWRRNPSLKIILVLGLPKQKGFWFESFTETHPITALFFLRKENDTFTGRQHQD